MEILHYPLPFLTMISYTDFAEIQTNLQSQDMDDQLIALYCFVDEFITSLQSHLLPYIHKPQRGIPPRKSFAIWLCAMITLALFFPFSGHKTYQSYHRFLMTHHKKDFPHLPDYPGFVQWLNTVSSFCYILAQMITRFFREQTGSDEACIKFADSTRLKVCENQRIQSHKVAKGKAGRWKSSRWWFYGFKLHIICDEWMRILGFTLTSGNTDDRIWLEMMWEGIVGMVVTDGGYVGKDFQEKAKNHGIFLLAAVRANMKKLMTTWQHTLFKMRQSVERVFSVLKYRMGMETSLPRSQRWYFARYIFCLTVYQIQQLFKTHPKQQRVALSKGKLA